MNSKVIKNDFSKLNLIVKALSDTQVVKIGVLASKANRKADKGTKVNNAEIGAIHELGAGLPIRSWLRMPIRVKNKQIIKEAGTGAAKLLLNGDKTLLLKRIGIAAENQISDAFETRGFGTWKANAKSTVKRKSRNGKTSDFPLVDKTFFKRSVASKVEKP